MRRRLQVRKDWFVRQATASKEGGGADAGEGKEEGEESELDEEGKILAEMDEAKQKAVHRAKKERKQRREAKKKARIRAAQIALGARPLSLPLSVAQYGGPFLKVASQGRRRLAPERCHIGNHVQHAASSACLHRCA